MPQKGSSAGGGGGGTSGPVPDLFNAHNFDVDIDIAIPCWFDFFLSFFIAVLLVLCFNLRFFFFRIFFRGLLGWLCREVRAGTLW